MLRCLHRSLFAALLLALGLCHGTLAQPPLLPATAAAVIDRTVYSLPFNPARVYIHISKPLLTLFVCEHRCTGLALIAAYPVCVGRCEGQKQCIGDFRTPESASDNPFVISEIVNASQWRHDFGDGRGDILAYGDWFLRLDGDFPGSGIGIHGSTGNRYSIPGRDSEGCIRLRDEDIVHLKQNYAFVGMPVYIERDK